MKKLLLFISISFLFFTNVYADTLDSCYDDYLHYYNVGSYNKPPFFRYIDSTWLNDGCGTGQNNSKPLELLIPVNPNSSTYVLFPSSTTGDNVSIWSAVSYDTSDGQGPHCLTTYNNQISSWLTWSFDSSTRQLVLTSTSDQYHAVSLGWSTMLAWNNFNRPVPWGTQTSGYVAIADFDLTTCPTPPTPPTPPSNATYDSFLDVFLDRFEFLATNFTSNPYLFTFIGIIFAWIILELFLRIFHIRGGYKK